jgi:tetratricopeptide (TPR) repeat protein
MSHTDVVIGLLDKGVELAQGCVSCAEGSGLAEAVPLFRAAIQHLEQPDKSPDLALAGWRNLGNALMGLRRSREAADAYDRAMQYLPETEGDVELRTEVRAECASAHVQVAAEAQQQQQQKAEVVEALLAAHKLQPTDEALSHALAGAHRALGAAYGGEGRLEEAITSTHAAIHLYPHAQIGAAAYVNLGLLLLRQVRSSRESSRGPWQRQRASSSSSAAAEARQALVDALHLDPAHGDAHYHLGNQMRAEGRTEEAIASFAKGLAAAPLHAGLRSSLGYSLIAHGDAHRGIALLQGPDAQAVWPNGAHARWQHPADLIDGLAAKAFHAAPNSPLGPTWGCIIAALEQASPAIATEAMALLPQFRVQHEAIAVPSIGWRELDLMQRCNVSNPRSHPPAGLERTCDVLKALSRQQGGRSKGGIELRGAAFSALSPSTRLLPHCGTTNGRLTVHLGLHVPVAGGARLRVGKPAAVSAADGTARVTIRTDGTLRHDDGTPLEATAGQPGREGRGGAEGGGGGGGGLRWMHRQHSRSRGRAAVHSCGMTRMHTR